MAKKRELRAVTPGEGRELRKLAASRTAPARLVERAKILVTMLDEPEIGAMEAGRRAGLGGQTGCAWVRRFNTGGLEVYHRELAGTGYVPREDMPIVCERFEVLRLSPAAQQTDAVGNGPTTHP